MRSTLLGYLPANLASTTLLDAGCGTGALSVEAAVRGARGDRHRPCRDPGAAREQRLPASLGGTEGTGRIDLRVGDMFDSGLGRSTMSLRWTR